MISAVTLILSPDLYCLTIKPWPYLEVEYVRSTFKNEARIIPATALPSSWLCLVKGIPTNPTTTPVSLPLPPKPTAVRLVVVVVGRLGWETVAPGGDPGRWVNEAAVGGDLLAGEEEQEQHLQPHPQQVDVLLLVMRKWGKGKGAVP